MKIGLVDVDSHNFPNLPLMKLSAYHKSLGNTVEWCNPLDHYDRVYQSKVFDDTYSPDIDWVPNTDEIIKGGTGYGLDNKLPEKVERMCPDYGLYPEMTNKADYGFLTRGCPRNCAFCIVSKKEGRISKQVADLSDFSRGNKPIKLLDPNILACKDREKLMVQLIDSKMPVDFTQGLDIRLANTDAIELINRVKLKEIHFAWDNAGDDLTKFFAQYVKRATHKPHGSYGTVYVLTNFGSSMEENLYRIYTLRDLGYDPYVMVYDKPNAPKEIKRLQRWCNNRVIFKSCPNFKDYDGGKHG